MSWVATAEAAPSREFVKLRIGTLIADIADILIVNVLDK